MNTQGVALLLLSASVRMQSAYLVRTSALSIAVYCLLRLQQHLQQVVMVSGCIGYHCNSPRVLLSAVYQLSDFVEHHILSESSFSSQQGPEALLQLKVDIGELSDWLQSSLCQPISGKT